MDERSWLEVRDKKHRYGKNLRMYYKEWDRLGRPMGNFFTWLSTTEEGVEGCPRRKLESNVVRYCEPGERSQYALKLDGRSMLYTADGKAVDSGPGGWLFVLRE
ncbi:unnamed protein product, partial [Discosporangium mesarthrocarpum]